MITHNNYSTNIKNLIGSTFKVSDGNSERALTLSEISPVKDLGKYETYSIFFSSDKTNFLPQSTYTFLHPELEDTELFIVPIAETPDAYQYQVCFSSEKA